MRISDWSSDVCSSDLNHDMIDVAPISAEDEGEGSRITRAQLIAVIRQRLEVLTGEIQKALKALGFDGPVGRQVVLTGGGAELKGIADYVQQALGRAVRVGRPRGLTALPDAHSGPAFSTLAGLAFFAASDPIDLRSAVPADQMIHQPRGLGAVRRDRKSTRLNSSH